MSTYGYLIPDTSDDFIDRFISIPNEILNFGNTDFNESGAIRVLRWNQSVEMIFKNPLGIGFYKFLQVYEHTPHNEYLHQIHNSGLIGGLSYMIFIGLCIILFYTKISNILKYSKSQGLIILNCFGITLFMMMCGVMETFHGNLFMSISYWFFLGLGISKVEYHTKKTSLKVG